MSISMCRVSVESRSHSLDSTISVKTFEMTHKVRRFSKHVRNKRNLSNKLVAQLPQSQKGSVTSQDINGQFMLSFPGNQNMFSMPDAPIPNFDRRTATIELDDNMKKMKNISISSLNLFNSRMLHKLSFSRLCNNDKSEQVMMEDFTKHCRKGLYTAVAAKDTDTDGEEKFPDRYDTD